MNFWRKQIIRKYIAIRTDDGKLMEKSAFYCMALEVQQQAFYDYLERIIRGNIQLYEMQKIHNEDECNDCYGRKRMYIR